MIIKNFKAEILPHHHRFECCFQRLVAASYVGWHFRILRGLLDGFTELPDGHRIVHASVIACDGVEIR
jgi:hypothetical protein